MGLSITAAQGVSVIHALMPCEEVQFYQIVMARHKDPARWQMGKSLHGQPMLVLLPLTKLRIGIRLPA